MNNCKQLRRQAHVEVKIYKRHVGTTDDGKSASCCRGKHMSKSKCTDQTILGPLLEVEMSKKCKPLRDEVRVEVKSVSS